METCGQIRCLIEEKDGAAGEVHQVEIRDAKLRSAEQASVGSTMAVLLILSTIAGGVYWYKCQTPEPTKRRVRVKYRLRPNR